jgi:hypothetical protein
VEMSVGTVSSKTVLSPLCQGAQASNVKERPKLKSSERTGD